MPRAQTREGDGCTLSDIAAASELVAAEPAVLIASLRAA
jgi:hypothetical protein